MAEVNKRQRNLLIVLILVLAIWGFRQVGGWFGGSGGDGLLGGSRNADFSAVLATEVEELALDRLDARPLEVVIGRSPWTYGPIPRPPQPPPQPVVRAPVKPVVTEPVEPVPTTPPKPKPPAIDVEFLGSLGTETRLVAVFSSGDLVINALVGDVVNDKFRVHAIGLESVDLAFVGFPDAPPERLPLKQK